MNRNSHFDFRDEPLLLPLFGFSKKNGATKGATAKVIHAKVAKVQLPSKRGHPMLRSKPGISITK
jgi:hypothetical protein